MVLTCDKLANEVQVPPVNQVAQELHRVASANLAPSLLLHYIVKSRPRSWIKLSINGVSSWAMRYPALIERLGVSLAFSQALVLRRVSVIASNSIHNHVRLRLELAPEWMQGVSYSSQESTIVCVAIKLL